MQEKEKARVAEIITRVNDLFDGELTERDRLVYVNNVIRGKLLELVILMQQAANNSKEQFANSPDLSNELLNAVMDALAAHNTMSKQALESERAYVAGCGIFFWSRRNFTRLCAPGPVPQRHPLHRSFAFAKTTFPWPKKRGSSLFRIVFLFCGVKLAGALPSFDDQPYLVEVPRLKIM